MTADRDYLRDRNRRLTAENSFLRATSDHLYRMLALLALIACENGVACNPVALTSIVFDLTVEQDAGMLHPEATAAREGQGI